ncbi:efflux RND transporter periplasmic adaptor subunit [Ancylobacter sp. MQZ15Z-1]|uniref:Efflux RND transporter periplasmic adaptor subunit n=1 Tax=Ancylobacter mangrovi TaxID=2972472 RepID=A0A9X2T3T8_9HYPH|nr:efflux RND transporter periplasmic adaptor subunit [Ancylobacter mangrovi]MCS0495321.1 efflux RND transporter periplasmic adaptor subunit [Ancylobacter mangrovi]
MNPSARRSGLRCRWLGAIVVVATAGALAACSEENKYVAPPPPQVTVTTPLAHPVTRYLELTGNTASINTVDLVARVEGFLTAIDYKDGAVMKKGDRLFLIQQDTYQADLDQSKAQLASAQAQLTNTQAEYQRQSTLGQQDFSSQAVVDKARAAMEQAQASVDAAKANIEIATINLGYTNVVAPFNGIVTRHLADVGQLVGHGNPTKLATIVQMDPIYAYFSLSENQVLRIKQALAASGRTIEQVKEVEIDIGLQNEGTSYPHKGHLDYVSPEVDPSTGTLLVRAVFDNKDLALLPGLFVRVRIPVQKIPDALLVEDTAISDAQQGRYVLVVDKDNVVQQKVITTGQQIGDLRVVETGLTVDDHIVVGGIQRATPGSKVDPQMQPPPKAPADLVAATPEPANGADAKPSDGKPSDAGKPADAKPAESAPAGTAPSGSAPSDSSPADQSPAKSAP